MRGEERFRVSWDHGDDSVRYDLWSFSWPQRWMACCALPLIRRLQRRFAMESPAAMQAAISSSGLQPPSSDGAQRRGGRQAAATARLATPAHLDSIRCNAVARHS
jgi:hypothetical protein